MSSSLRASVGESIVALRFRFKLPQTFRKPTPSLKQTYSKCLFQGATLSSTSALTGVTLRLTLNASTPAWMTGAKTVSLSAVSANMSGIWSRRLQRQARGLWFDTDVSHCLVNAFTTATLEMFDSTLRPMFSARGPSKINSDSAHQWRSASYL